MTIRHKTPTHTHPDEMFPEFPPRDDMNNPLYLHVPAHMASLARHLGFPETTLVLGEVPVGWRPTGPRLFRGHSDVLGLDICWEYGQLRFYDPVEGRYLPTFDEEADGRLAAEAEVQRLREELARLRSEK